MQARVVGVSSEVMATMEQFRPDLVLTDLHMPGLDGAEITALIRAHAAFAPTPIVFLTGDPDPETQFEEIGRASGRERGCQYGEIQVVAELLKKKKKQND